MNRTAWKMVRWIPLVKKYVADKRFWQCITEANRCSVDPLAVTLHASKEYFIQYKCKMKHARWYANIFAGKPPFRA